MSLAFLAAFMVAVAITIHLGSEFASLGGLAFSSAMLARHHYLLGAGLGALAGITLVSNLFGSVPARRQRLADLVAGLPLQERRSFFIAACFATQLLLFAGSQAYEGNPLRDGNMPVGCIVAVLSSLGAAFFIDALPQRVVKILAATYVLRSAERSIDARILDVSYIFGRVFLLIPQTYQAVVGCRPPPAQMHVA